MPVRVRRVDERFLDDMKRTLGDVDNVLRSPPSRAELEEYQQLCGLLWGFTDDDQRLPELESELAAYLRVQSGETIEIRYTCWGGQFLDFLPWPQRVPRCRIWLLKQDGLEYLIAMTDVSQIEDGHFPDLTGTVAPRTKTLYPDSFVEQCK